MGDCLSEDRGKETGMSYEEACLAYSRGIIDYDQLVKRIKEII